MDRRVGTALNDAKPGEHLRVDLGSGCHLLCKTTIPVQKHWQVMISEDGSIRPVNYNDDDRTALYSAVQHVLYNTAVRSIRVPYEHMGQPNELTERYKLQMYRDEQREEVIFTLVPRDEPKYDPKVIEP
jgi:hypothetical protein